MKVCRSDQCIYCEEFSVTHTIQKIGFMTSILLELEGNCAGHRTEIPFTVTRYRYIGNIYDVIVQHSLYIYETMLCNNNNFFFWQGEKRIKFGSIQTPKKLLNVNCLNGRGKKKRVSNAELTKRILGRGVFSYSRILSDSFIQSTVIQNLNSYANTPVWKVL
jgi:hypothetical protein